MKSRKTSLRRQILRLEAQRARVLQTLLSSQPLLRGSLSQATRTCGNPTCHCAQGPGHPVWALATRQGVSRRCQVVRKADVEEVSQRVAVYREFRHALRRLQAIQKELKALLNGYLEERDLPYE